MKKKYLIVVLILNFLTFEAFSQEVNWFGKSTIKSIVLLQKFEKGQYVNHGVGILTTHSDFDKCIIVTCEHVLRNNHIYVVVNPDTVLINKLNRLNTKTLNIQGVDWTLDGKLLRAKIDLIKNKTFVKHPEGIDIAAFSFSMSDRHMLKDSLIIPFTNTVYIGNKNFGDKSMVNLGEEVYFIGFPFGFGVNESLEPLLRSGVVSWVSSSNSEFLLDAISYGGNSGSPIFTKMTPLNNNWLKPYFIGMVIGHYGYEHENFGLARCVYFDDIKVVMNGVKTLVNK